MYRIKAIALWVVLLLLATSCYQEQGFDVPGPFDDVPLKTTDTIPYVFSGENEQFLIRDGVPDFTKMSVLGYSDFAVEMPDNYLSWYSGTDLEGKRFFGCREHRNPQPLRDDDHYGRNAGSYQFNQLVSKLFLSSSENAVWRVYARMSLSYLGHEYRSLFSLSGALGWDKRFTVGFDWWDYIMFFQDGLRKLDGTRDGLQYNANTLAPGSPFDLEIVRVGKEFFVRINGRVIWRMALDENAEQWFPLIFQPWKNKVNFYELSIEGDYQEWQTLTAQQEGGYKNIQAPALASAGGRLLIVAEGRKYNAVQTSRMDADATRSNETDLVMKYSDDGGTSWSDLKVLKSDGVYMRPTIITDGDRILLFYTVDADGKQTGNYRIEMIVSENAGTNWSEPQEITTAVKEGYIVSTLSGHGLKTAAGGYALPLQCRTGNKGTVALLYSADGVTWTLGTPVEGLRWHSANLVERDGKLQMYLGNNAAGNARKVVSSSDNGTTWTEPENTSIPVGTGGQLSYGATLATGDGRLLHITSQQLTKGTDLGMSSFDADPQAEYKARPALQVYRAPYNLTGGIILTTSKMDGITWDEGVNLWKIPSYKEFKFYTGAMDAVLSGDELIVVTEAGVAVPYEGLALFKKKVESVKEEVL